MHDMKKFLGMLQSVDAFFPIGAFTLSNGLEDYVMRERIQSSQDLAEYLKGFLQIFSYNDLGILALAYMHYQDQEYLLQLDGIANACKSAKEVRIGSNRICNRYIKARKAMQDCCEELSWYMEEIQKGNAKGIHPIALGIMGAESGIDIEHMLTMYGYSILSAIVNNAVKLVPLSQLEGQRILFEQLEALESVAQKATDVSVMDIGIAGTAYDVHCMNHEKLYSRQYMS